MRGTAKEQATLEGMILVYLCLLLAAVYFLLVRKTNTPDASKQQTQKKLKKKIQSKKRRHGMSVQQTLNRLKKNQYSGDNSAHWFGVAKTERSKRLLAGYSFSLFHQTDEKSAKAIEEEGFMLRGSTGLAGGAIYFATKSYLTGHKAHKHGALLVCRVDLGRVKKVGVNGDRSITFQSLQAEGYDSVRIDRPGGIEYIVYSHDQVSQVTNCSQIRDARRRKEFLHEYDNADYAFFGGVNPESPVSVLNDFDVNVRRSVQTEKYFQSKYNR